MTHPEEGSLPRAPVEVGGDPFSVGYSVAGTPTPVLPNSGLLDAKIGTLRCRAGSPAWTGLPDRWCYLRFFLFPFPTRLLNVLPG